MSTSALPAAGRIEVAAAYTPDAEGRGCNAHVPIAW